MLPLAGDEVCAGIDLAFRGDSSALIIVHRRDHVLRVAEVVELRPREGQPLKPSAVIRTFAERMAEHGCTYAVGDKWYREAVIEHLTEFGLAFADAPSPPSVAYVRTRELMREGRVRLPRHERLLAQLREVEGRATPGGGMSIVHPRWRTGGHGDLVAALVLALYQLGGDEVKAAEPEMGTEAWEEAQRKKRRQALLEKQGRDWWRGGSTRSAPAGGLAGRVARAEAALGRRRWRW